MLLYEKLSEKVIKAMFTVHNELGCGFMEKVYQEALAIQLAEMDIPFEREKEMTVCYHGRELECKFVADFVVDNKIIIELKAVKKLDPVFAAQLINYLKITGIKIGLLANFGETRLNFQRIACFK